MNWREVAELPLAVPRLSKDKDSQGFESVIQDLNWQFVVQLSIKFIALDLI